MPNPDTVAVPQVMDREFIARNRIVELYLSGSLPVRGATVFEQFCRENPQILDEIGLPERVHTALRLLTPAANPNPGRRSRNNSGSVPTYRAALSGLVLVLGIALLVLNRQVSEQTRKVTALASAGTRPAHRCCDCNQQRRYPTYSCRTQCRHRTTIGGSSAQMVNIKIAMTHSDFRAFRVTI